LAFVSWGNKLAGIWLPIFGAGVGIVGLQIGIAAAVALAGGGAVRVAMEGEGEVARPEVRETGVMLAGLGTVTGACWANAHPNILVAIVIVELFLFGLAFWGEIPIAFGGTLSISVRTTPIRIVSIVCYWREGFLQLPQNFKHNLLVVDIKQPAELVQRYSAHGAINSSNLLKRLPNKDHGVGRFVNFIFFIILLLSAYIYRFSLKASFLVNFPIIFVFTGKTYMNYSPEHFADLIKKTPLNKTRLIAAVLFSLSGITYNIYMRLPEFPNKQTISLFEYFFVIDYRFFERPWKIFARCIVTINFYLWFTATRLERANLPRNNN
jgi:hypothetical protein